jgi:hypothetical protein
LSDSKEPTVLLNQKLVTEASQLLKTQEALDKDLADNSEYLGLSLNETVYGLVRAGYSKRAQKIQSEFKMPEKTFWWLRLRALVAKRDWGELEEIAKVKKSPIGWEVRLRTPKLPLHMLTKTAFLQRDFGCWKHKTCFRIRAKVHPPASCREN